jgi:hypothetical protein
VIESCKCEGCGWEESDIEESENIAVDTKEQCIGVLNIEVGNEILNLLIKVAEKLLLWRYIVVSKDESDGFTVEY